eukprot:GHVP01029682.1.p1 GENE.GHVP01029682.1~~GHVP01029682.1.p1  ORF type:complete len:501 (-),score=98.87 GHVP01029682.1:1521-3023(-)
MKNGPPGPRGIHGPPPAPPLAVSRASSVQSEENIENIVANVGPIDIAAFLEGNIIKGESFTPNIQISGSKKIRIEILAALISLTFVILSILILSLTIPRNLRKSEIPTKNLREDSHFCSQYGIFFDNNWISNSSWKTSDLLFEIKNCSFPLEDQPCGGGACLGFRIRYPNDFRGPEFDKDKCNLAVDWITEHIDHHYQDNYSMIRINDDPGAFYFPLVDHLPRFGDLNEAVLNYISDPYSSKMLLSKENGCFPADASSGSIEYFWFSKQTVSDRLKYSKEREVGKFVIRKVYLARTFGTNSINLFGPKKSLTCNLSNLEKIKSYDYGVEACAWLCLHTDCDCFEMHSIPLTAADGSPSKRCLISGNPNTNSDKEDSILSNGYEIDILRRKGYERPLYFDIEEESPNNAPNTVFAWTWNFDGTLQSCGLRCALHNGCQWFATGWASTEKEAAKYCSLLGEVEQETLAKIKEYSQCNGEGGLIAAAVNLLNGRTSEKKLKLY